MEVSLLTEWLCRSLEKGGMELRFTDTRVGKRSYPGPCLTPHPTHTKTSARKIGDFVVKGTTFIF